MALEKIRNAALPVPFGVDRRDRHPGTHFATELGAPPRRKRRKAETPDDPHVDEDLGVSAFGLDLPFLHH